MGANISPRSRLPRHIYQILTFRPAEAEWAVAYKWTGGPRARWRYVDAPQGADHAERISYVLMHLGADPERIEILFRGEKWATMGEMLRSTPEVMRMFREAEVEEEAIARTVAATA